MKIGKVVGGVLRGFAHDTNGLEVTTHFYQEGDMLIGTLVPNTHMTYTIQAMTDCELSVAGFEDVVAQVNKDVQITEVIRREFHKLNQHMQSRLVSLLNLDSVSKYKLFLNDYPGILNRIPHYYVAQYLGITPTQLSRARRKLASQE